MLIFDHKSKDIAPYLVYTNDDNFILDKKDIGGGADVPDPADTVPIMDGAGAIGTSDKYARADHVHPSDSSKADAADIPGASDTLPIMDGTADAGESAKYARADHVHPTDTGRASATHTHGNITNAGGLSGEAPTIASGDCLVIDDVSENKLAKGAAFGTDTTKYLRNDGSWAVPGLVFLSYGNSNWADFEAAYSSGRVVYCRASSSADPSSGTQSRLAFMAYVNNVENPTEVEFQYYRSVATHSASQQGDQVFVYKLHKTNGWSVTTREAASKIAVAAPLSTSYASGTLTISETAPTDSADASDVAVADSTNTNIVSKAPGKGTWLVCGKATFPNNSTGRRSIKLSTNSQESSNVVSTQTQNAVSGGTTQISTCRVFVIANTSDKVYLVGWQNSGSSLNCSGGLEFTRLA